MYILSKKHTHLKTSETTENSSSRWVILYFYCFFQWLDFFLTNWCNTLYKLALVLWLITTLIIIKSTHAQYWTLQVNLFQILKQRPTRRIAALKSPGDLLQTAPSINPPALVPRAAVNWGWEYPKWWSVCIQASKSSKPLCLLRNFPSRYHWRPLVHDHLWKESILWKGKSMLINSQAFRKLIILSYLYH